MTKPIIIQIKAEGDIVHAIAGSHSAQIMPNGHNVRFEIDYGDMGIVYSFAPDIQTAKERILRALNEHDPTGNYQLPAE